MLSNQVTHSLAWEKFWAFVVIESTWPLKIWEQVFSSVIQHPVIVRTRSRYAHRARQQRGSNARCPHADRHSDVPCWVKNAGTFSENGQQGSQGQDSRRGIPHRVQEGGVSPPSHRAPSTGGFQQSRHHDITDNV